MKRTSTFAAALIASAVTAMALASPIPVHAGAAQAGITRPAQHASDISAQSKKSKKPARKAKKAKKTAKGHLGHH